MNRWDRISKSFHHISKTSIPHSEKYKIVSALVIKNKWMNLLDLGAGSGLLEKQLLRDGYRGKVDAYEESLGMFNLATKINDRNKIINFINEDFTAKKIDALYDCVIMINVLYLLNNQCEFLRKISKNISAGGSLIIINPKPDGNIRDLVKENIHGKSFFRLLLFMISQIKFIYHGLIFAIEQKRIDRDHLNSAVEYLELEELKKALTAAGFKIKKITDIQAKQNWLIVAEVVK